MTFIQLYSAESCDAKSAEDLLEELQQLHKNTKRGIRQNNPLPGTHTGIFSAIHGTIPWNKWITRGLLQTLLELIGTRLT